LVNRVNLFSGIVIGLVFLLLLHHAITHGGILFEQLDFQNGLGSLFKSHEAIIVLLLIFFLGALAGSFIFKKEKRS